MNTEHYEFHNTKAEADYESRYNKTEADFEFRYILTEEGDQAADMEEVCFPPNEACPRAIMIERVERIPELFLVAADKRTGRLAGFLNGLATNEESFRDEFFTDSDLHDPSGANIMLCGLEVLPEFRGRGLAHELVEQYARRERARGRKKLILTCLEEKVSFYEAMGFEDCGLSASVWGGEAWHEMRRSLT